MDNQYIENTNQNDNNNSANDTDFLTFLGENPPETQFKEINVSFKRTDKNDKEITVIKKFIISQVSSEQHAEYVEQCNRTKGSKVRFDESTYSKLICLNHTLDEKNKMYFRDANRLGKYSTPVEFISKILTIGEIQSIRDAILEFSGISSDSEDIVTKAKKS